MQGEWLVAGAIDAGLLLAVAAASLALWRPTSNAMRRTARVLWFAAALCYVAHVAAAFHFVHAWSHAAAWRHTAERTAEVVGARWGFGLWINYLVLLVWPLEAAALFRQPTMAPVARWRKAWYAAWAFLAFQATVVFDSGPVRWAGLIATVWLAILCWRYAWSGPFDNE